MITQRIFFKIMNECNEQARKRALASLYRKLNRVGRESSRKDKKTFLNRRRLCEIT